MSGQSVLVGRTIAGIDLATDRKAIRFRMSDGESVVARTDGDCCSSSWVEAMDTPELIVGSPVLSVENIDMPDRGRPNEYGVITYYGCKITTTKGACVIDYRNESNGYYGGSLEWPGDYFYGGVYGQNVSTEQWETVAGEPAEP